MKKIISLAVAALSGGAVLASAIDAKAAPTCSSLTGSNAVVTIAGSSASQPIWAAIAAQLTGISIIYQAPSSCVGLSDVTTGATETAQPLYMDGSASGVECTGSNPVDIGVSDVYPASCGSAITWPAAGFQDFPGPVQAMTIVVPYASTAYSISYDAAYVVFGWGASNPQYQVTPWTTSDEVFIRTTTSGTETMIGSAIGLAPSKWLSQAPDAGSGQQETSTGNMIKGLQTAAAGATPGAAIGILSVTNADNWHGAPDANDAGTPKRVSLEARRTRATGPRSGAAFTSRSLRAAAVLAGTRVLVLARVLLGAVGPAAALALAGVLSLAGVLVGLAAAKALAGVLSLAGMLGAVGRVELLDVALAEVRADARLRMGDAAHAENDSRNGSGEQM